MATVLLAHSDPLQRESLAAKLGAKGFSVVPVPDVESALDSADGAIALLVEPDLLLREEMEVQTRVDLRAGRAVRIIALTHKAPAQEMAAFRRHGAGLLARPLEDLERLATMLRIQATDDAPWEPQKAPAKPAPAPPPAGWAKMPRLPEAGAKPWDPSAETVPPDPKPEAPQEKPKKKKRWWGKKEESAEGPAANATATVVSAVAPPPPIASPPPPPAPPPPVDAPAEATPAVAAPAPPTKSPWAEEEEELYGAAPAPATEEQPLEPPSVPSPLADAPEEPTTEQEIGTRVRTAVSAPSEEHDGEMPAATRSPAHEGTPSVPPPPIDDPSVLDAPAFAATPEETAVSSEAVEPTIASAWAEPPPETHTAVTQISPEPASDSQPPASLAVDGFFADPEGAPEAGVEERTVASEGTVASEPTVAWEADAEATVAAEEMPDQVPEPPEQLDSWESEIGRALNPQGPSVLVVDDESTFRGFLRDVLAERGFRVHTAINASNALRFLKTNGGIDLVISDLNMPHMDGFELKHEIDQIIGRSMPFIIVTADTSDDKIQTAAQVGAAALVPKPIEDLDAFHAIVLDTLRDAGVMPRSQ